MTLTELRERAEGVLREKLDAQRRASGELVALRAAVDTDTTITEDRVRAAIEARDAASRAVDAANAEVERIDVEIAEEQRFAELAQRVIPTGAQRSARPPATVTSEPRTYAREADPAFDSRSERFRPGATAGQDFLRDVTNAYLGDPEALQRLQQHKREERAERGDNYLQRAAGTGAFAGLVVPQYLVDLYAPAITNGRPFADICRKHELPATGMTAYIGRVTTSTSVGDQANEGDLVAEQDIDDTLITVPIRTAAGSQDLSRQAIERGVGTEDVTIEDLFAQYGVNLDSKLLNAATSGLTNVATAITYTDASPTGAEFWPKLVQASAAVETALKGLVSQPVHVMTSTRWYWLQSQLISSWPLIGHPGIGASQGGVNYATKYGAGFRGLLPNGTPVVTDNNIAQNLGAGTNQDETFTVDPSECHLWEDPNAPMLIRAEQPKAKNLQVSLVVYGYYAFTYARRPHAQKVSGTGLIVPTSF